MDNESKVEESTVGEPESHPPITGGPHSEKSPRDGAGGVLDPVTQNDNQNAEPGQEDEYVSGLRLMILLSVLCMVIFLQLLDVSVVTTAIPRITTDFHSLTDVGWYGSAYLLANAALQPLAGKLYTQFASKWIYLSFFAIFELGSLLCGVATSSKMLIVGRAVAGMGGAGMMNGGMTIVACCTPLHKRPVYMGAMIGIGQMGVVFGPLIGGALTEYTTWRWCFYINLPLGGLVAIFLVLIHIPHNIEPRRISLWQTVMTKLDPVGFTLFAPATIQFLLALEYGGDQYPWRSATVIGLFCGAGGTCILFLIWEYRQKKEAMIPLSMLKVRAVWSSCLVIIFYNSMQQLVLYYLPIYFQAIKNASPMMSGVDLLPSILSQLLGAVGSGVLVTKLGYCTPFSVASSSIASVGHGLLSTFMPGTSTGKWVGYQILVGFGRGLGLQMPFVAVQNTLPKDMVSVSMSLLVFAQTLAASVMLTIGQTIFANGLDATIPTYAKGVDPEAVIQAGATGIRALISNPTELLGVLTAYSKSIDRVFYLAIGCSCACFLCSWGMGWKDIRKKPKEEATNMGESV